MHWRSEKAAWACIFKNTDVFYSTFILEAVERSSYEPARAHSWWRSCCPRLIFSDSPRIILWSKQSRLTRLSDRLCHIAAVVWQPLRQVGRINSTAQPFYIWIPTGGTLWRRTQGHRRDGSTSYYFSMHHSKFVYPWMTTYWLPEQLNDLFVRKLRLMAGRGFKQTKKQKELLFFPTALIKPWTCIYLRGGGQDSSRMMSGPIRSVGSSGRSEVNEDKDTEGNWLVMIPLELEDHAWPFTVQSLGFWTG